MSVVRAWHSGELTGDTAQARTTYSLTWLPLPVHTILTGETPKGISGP